MGADFLKTPEPIILPMMIIVAVNNPSFATRPDEWISTVLFLMTKECSHIGRAKQVEVQVKE
jgi:hypothetical protein